MRIRRHSNPTFHAFLLTFSSREWSILLLFILLALAMLYPLSTNLSNMVPEPTDPLLNAWRMQWNARAFLSGPSGIANLFNANIFYPFPLTLAYSEHFLMITAQALPFLLLADSHLFGMNLSVLVTFVLSGYAMYLLVTDWTGNRWAGLVAGVLFAFSPHRFGQLNHLELLVTQWMPLALLALHWTLTRPGGRYPLLFGIFFNLQALSGFHYSLNLTLACVLLALVYALSGRIRWRRGLWLAGGLSIAATLLLNWPVWRMYLRFSDVMGAIRTPGEVRIYSAALTDYVTAIPYNLLYGWTFGYWDWPNHQVQPLMPVGGVGILLAIIALLSLIPISRYATRNTQHDASRITHHLSTPTFHVPRSTKPIIIFLLLLTLLALLLSFGLNENALGEGLAPLLRYSPYGWLYENVAAFQGIRVPGRYGILTVVGLSALAGLGAAHVHKLQFAILNSQFSKLTSHIPHPTSHIPHPTSRTHNSQFKIIPILLVGLILLESWSAPLVGPEFPAGQNIPPVYRWLQTETPAEAVVLELPHQGASEFLYEYYASHHWRRLANGGTGFTPPIYKELRRWFNAFPDPRSVDIIQQMGIDVIILHADAYAPEDWQRVLADLPRYLPAIEQIHQVGDTLALRVANPLCHPDTEAVTVGLAPTQLDGLPHAAEIVYHNTGPAAFVADVTRVSQLTFEGGGHKNFTEPLVTPAGESQAVVVPLQRGQPERLMGAELATLERNAPAGRPPKAEPPSVEPNWQPLGLQYAGGPQLAAYALSPENPTACGQLTVALNWQGGQPGDSARVQLLDPFGRPVTEDVAHPWNGQNGQVDVRHLPLVGTLPPGRYGLRVLVHAAGGTERFPVTEEDVTIPTNQIPPLPVDIHPAPHPLPAAAAAPAHFADDISLLGGKIMQEQVQAGDWLRFRLVWQAQQPLNAELTVFTQLLGPNGQVWGQYDNRPGGGWYSTSLWQPGRPVVDDYAFQIQPDAPPGTYKLIAGLYHSDTQQRLPVAGGGDFIEIGTVEVE